MFPPIARWVLTCCPNEYLICASPISVIPENAPALSTLRPFKDTGFTVVGAVIVCLSYRLVTVDVPLPKVSVKIFAVCSAQSALGADVPIRNAPGYSDVSIRDNKRLDNVAISLSFIS